jgi:hypothetical protein
MSWCMRITTCPGGDMVGGVCDQCGLPDSHEHYATSMDSNVHPVLRYEAPPTWPPIGPGPLTEMERVVELGICVYDASKEPAQAVRDLAVKGVFGGLRRLFYRRR